MIDLQKKFPFRKEHFQLYSHPDCLLHEVGELHPEIPERLRSILRGCKNLPVNLPISFKIPQPAELSHLELVHDREYRHKLEASCQNDERTFMSPDNHINRNTFRSVLAAGGCAVALADTLLGGGAGFALIRPPGHHSSRNNAEGFCFINHIALAIALIRQKQPDAIFLIVDFDVHHGNGIDYIFCDDPKVFYYSLHGTPVDNYPHTGYVHETGRGAGVGYTRNITLPLECSGDDWLRHFEANLCDCEQKVRPDYLLIGAGFDAHRDDPFGIMNVEDYHFLSAARRLKKTAYDYCGGRFGFFLEGGYSSTVLERLVPEVIKVLATSPSLDEC